MKGEIIKIFYDVETTGVDPRKHSIIQLAGFIEVDGEVVEEFNLRMTPHPRAFIDPIALEVNGKTFEEIQSYKHFKDVYDTFIAMLSKYIARYDKSDKAYLIGFNNRRFDDAFLRKWFELCGSSFFNAWFWSDSIDVMVLASQALIGHRPLMSNFKLATVAEAIGVDVDKDKLHDALYDIYLTKAIYDDITQFM